MGNFWKDAGRAGLAIYSGGLTEYGRALEGSGDDDEARRGREYDEQRAQIYDAQGNIILDEYGYTPVTPGRRVAQDAQFQSERFIAAKNARTRADALNTLQGGLGLLESYRPGGAAALTSPYYQQMANVLMASQLEAPDLLGEVRRHAQGTANKAARKAEYAQYAGAALTVAGAAFGGPAGAALGAGAGAALTAGANKQAANAQQNADAQQEPYQTPGAAGGPYGGFQAGGAPTGAASTPTQAVPVGPGAETSSEGDMPFASAGGQQGRQKGVQAGGGGIGGGIGGGAGAQPGGGAATGQAGPGQRGPSAGGGGQAQGQGGPSGGGMVGGGSPVAQMVAMSATASLNGPDYWSRLLTSLDDFELQVEAILHA